jgi:Tfp pilus assembly protein PilZ
VAERRQLDRRTKPRIARRLSARFGTDAKMAGGTVVDISEGGMRIDAPETFPLNSIIIVFVQFPRHAIRLRARVTWCTGKESAKQAMGLTFTKPEPSLTKAYGEWVAEVRQAVKETPPMASDSAPDAAPRPGAAPDPGAPAPGKPAPPPAREPTGPVRRRLESRNGAIFEALIEPRLGGWRLTVRQLPRPALRDPYDLDRECSSYADAEAALVAFVRSR